MAQLIEYPAQEEVFRSERTLVFRSRDPRTSTPVVLKVLRDPRPPREQFLWFKREHKILENLAKVEGVPTALDFGLHDERWTIVQEDIGGQPLSEMIKSRRLRTEEFLEIAAPLAAIVAQVHARDVIHKDINPSNVVVNRGTGRIRLIDFGIATELSRESVAFEGPGAMEGTLAYISPEQTGRMNRSIDHRADLYSLGATFYHMLTGRMPFTTTDPVAMVHAHIARVPKSPATISRRIPKALSDIIDRLLAKAPEDRYQSAEGLSADLEECLRQERELGEITPFELDRHHLPTRLLLPEQLYGRDAEQAELLAAFERAADGAAEVVLVAGYSGVGKSALVHELYRPITERNGFFIAGKFDQLRRDVPNAVILEALRDLTRQLLRAPEQRLERWRSELQEAVSPNGQVLLDVLPELQPILGSQPPAPELSGGESRNRLQLVLTRLFQTFARAEHPLTVFLDDLQWVDAGSLELLEALLSGGQLEHLLIIGAYRDNEVSPGHPLLLALNRLKNAGVQRTDIELSPLGEDSITELLVDAVRRDAAAVASLAKLVIEKTNGNPFFAREFLKELYAEDLLHLEDGQWTWDRKAIRARGIKDNVVELITAQMRALEPATQHVLQLAGSLGNRFDVETLAVADGRSVAETWKALWPAGEGGYLIILNDAYKLVGLELEDDEEDMEIPVRFAHDRVQQSAFALADRDARVRGAWQTGRRLLARWPVEAHPDRLFEIVGHLNTGRESAKAQDDRDLLAELNLRAAQRAHVSAAFGAAYEHAKLGVELLGAQADERRYDLLMPLLNVCVETAYQTANYDALERWYERAVHSARNVLDTAWINEMKTEALNAQGRPLDALAHALTFLAELGVDCPREPGYDEVVAEMNAAGALLANRTIYDLERAPDIEDPAIRTAVSLICKVYSSAYVASPFVFAVLTLRQFQLVVKHGNCAVSPLSYAVYGLLMAGLANDVKSAYAFGALSSRMLDRPDVKRYEAQAIHLFNCHTRMWKEHLKVCAAGERRAYQVGLETGEMEFGCYGGHVGTKYSLFHGEDLARLRDEAEQYTAAMKRYRQDLPFNSHASWHQAIINLTEQRPMPHRLAGEVLDSRGARTALEAVNDRMAISNALTAELLLCTVFGEFSEAVQVGGEGNGFLDAVLSQFNQPLHMFLDAHARLTLWHDADEDERPALREAAEGSLAALRVWSEHASINLGQKVALLEAMLATVDGRDKEARDRFDRAIELCRRNEFLLDEAIANESAARFLARAGRDNAARHYLEDAHQAYVRWGAAAKVEVMELAYPELRPRRSATGSLQVAVTQTASATTITSKGDSLDMEALVRAAQAISSEVVLSDLLQRLMATVMENAGAGRAVLVLTGDDGPTVEAEAVADGEIEVLQSQPLVVQAGGTGPVPSTVFNLARRSGELVVLDDAAQHPRYATDPYIATRQTRSALCVPLKNQGQITGVLYLENDRVAGVFTPERASLLRLLAGQIAISIDNARLYANLEERVTQRTAQLEARNTFIRRVFGRYLSDDVVDTLLDSKTALQLGGEGRVITMMFTDLRGFTAMCEKLTPEQAMRTLNNYLAAMTGIIERHGGNINNIIGDGLFVLFGAPVWREDHAERAVQCALEMQLALPQVNEASRAEGLPPVFMGVGIHTGEVVVGNIGSETRAKYSVIGRHANLASRVEANAASEEVFVSEATRDACQLPLRVASERMIHPKGIDQPLPIFRVVGITDRPELTIPEPGGEREPVAPPRPVVLRWVDGKSISSERVDAQLVGVGPRSVELVVPTTVKAGTDIAIESNDGLVYAKVSGTGTTCVATVTAGETRGL